MKKAAAAVLLLVLAGLILVLGRRGHAPQPIYQYQAAQRVAYYRVAQVGAVERQLGYRVVEPSRTIKGTTGLRLTELVVTEWGGRKAIDYVFGDLHARWVMVLETADALTPYHYDAEAEWVAFASHGRGISVTTNLGKATLDRIAQRMGAAAPRSAKQG